MKKTDMRTVIDRRLSGIQFERQEAVIQGLGQADRKRFARPLRLVPLLALILALLLATVALAVSLTLSARMDARQQAVEALGQAYRLNEETIGLFEVSVQKEGTGWLVRLTPKNVYLAQVGEYQVEINHDQAPSTTWSLEDSPRYAPDKGLSSPVWGQKQLLEYKREVEDYHGRMSQVDWEQAGQSSLAERAQIDRDTRPAGTLDSYAFTRELHVVPNEGDLQPEQALAQRMADAGQGDLLEGAAYLPPTDGFADEAHALKMALDALQTAYGLQPDSLNLFIQNFALRRVDGEPQWVLTLSPRERLDWPLGPETPVGEYTARLDAQAKTVLDTTWTLAGVETGRFTQSTWAGPGHTPATSCPGWKR